MNQSGQDYPGIGEGWGPKPIVESRRREVAYSAALVIEPDEMRAVGLKSLLMQELNVVAVSAAADLSQALAGLPENTLAKYLLLGIPKPVWTTTLEWAELRWVFHLSELIVLVSPVNRDSLLGAFASRPSVLLPYDCTADDLRAGLRDLQQGRPHWDSGLLQAVSESLIERRLAHMQALSTPQTDARISPELFSNQDGELGTLTTRELNVLQGLSEGCTNRELSESLDIAERTVAFHITNLYSKLNARSRTELGMRGRCASCSLKRDLPNLPEVAGISS